MNYSKKVNYFFDLIKANIRDQFESSKRLKVKNHSNLFLLIDCRILVIICLYSMSGSWFLFNSRKVKYLKEILINLIDGLLIEISLFFLYGR